MLRNRKDEKGKECIKEEIKNENIRNMSPSKHVSNSSREFKVRSSTDFWTNQEGHRPIKQEIRAKETNNELSDEKTK